MHLPIFSDCHFPHRFFFPPGESLFFFGWIDTWKFPPTPRRGIINYRVVARNAPVLHLSLSPFSYSVFFFPLLGLEFRGMYVRQLQSSHFARSIARHERTKRGRLHGVAWRTASRRIASNRVASRRIASIGRGLQDYIDVQTLRCTLHMLEDYPARQYEITFVRQRLAAGGSDWV